MKKYVVFFIVLLSTISWAGQVNLKKEDYIQLGDIFLKFQQYPNAVQNYFKVTELDPYNADAYYHLGTAQLQWAKSITETRSIHLDSARKSFRDALKYNPYHIDALLALGESYVVEKQYSAAGKYYKKILKLNPEHRDALFNLAVVQSHINLNASEKTLKKLIAISPDDKQAITFRKYVAVKKKARPKIKKSRPRNITKKKKPEPVKRFDMQYRLKLNQEIKYSVSLTNGDKKVEYELKLTMTDFTDKKAYMLEGEIKSKNADKPEAIYFEMSSMGSISKIEGPFETYMLQYLFPPYKGSVTMSGKWSRNPYAEYKFNKTRTENKTVLADLDYYESDRPGKEKDIWGGEGGYVVDLKTGLPVSFDLSIWREKGDTTDEFQFKGKSL